MMLKKSPRLTWWWTASIVFLVFAFIMAFFGFPKIVSDQMRNKLSLVEGSKAYDAFKELPFPMAFKVYIFNVTNPDDVSQGRKPKLQEIGPYVYDEYRFSEIVAVDEENDTIDFKLQKKFYFNQSLSGELTEDDTITYINIGYMALILKAADMLPASMLPMLSNALDEVFGNVSIPFQQSTVRELLFDGLYMDCNSSDVSVSLLCGRMKVQNLTVMRPAEDGNGFYFSMFDYLNTTSSPVIRLNRGYNDLTKRGLVEAYDNRNDTSNLWHDQHCGALNGTIGPMAPSLEDNIPQKFYTFQPDLCRSIFTELVTPEAKVFNITAARYETSWMTLASKNANPSNKCFCKKNWSKNHDGCLINGLLNLEPCKQVPVIASFPHFYLASEELMEYISKGIKPNKTLHSSYLYVEPETGTVLRGSQKLQFNIELRQMDKVKPLQNVTTGLFPLLWIDEGAEVTADLVETLNQNLTAMKYVAGVRWGILTVAIVLAIICTAVAIRGTKNSRLHSVNVSSPQPSSAR